MTNKEKLDFLFKKHNIILNNDQIDKFIKYYDILIETNKFLNLTSITEFDDVVVKHFIDSVLNYKHFEINSKLCDIGSGAGLPGIPLKIMRPDLEITLVDSLNKRINFLNNVINILNLDKITTIHTRAQELPQNNVSCETFDYVTARAVAPLNVLCELCLPFVKVNGEFIALKSTKIDEEISNAENALNILNSTIKKIETYNIYLNNEAQTRKIVYITKNTKTPHKYPRTKNLIKTNPL